ncbi:amino acid ABC transporter permease [Bosea sp. (in: a-proteobacteria)]|jgi:His/Glu/Gln/Arg/opine family amino acid ABC transporter permease subunit|uniref:amino acid ABC transporter permease n=1 Tax=Bosea sp. (in: a-proteobacteria) TaxID=1871050 RepID=UPI00086DBC85|nr:amino acid ABC transporter permease [Bosea sp. (in: a-proteobacteria)]MBN9438028.1 amino acid ABC transporter permease [Bosea sp. (in: a-proteobacteria)]MBN9470407.1 amino acid ABC transporter permease [Bosea sp. (in: a-proteobacteria)]ODT55098.1 MAG: amino acid ABC transporter permease [Methylobacterium sp. SCN 67-24]
MDFSVEAALAALPALLRATGTNIAIAAAAMALALAGGILLTILRSLKIAPLNLVIGVVISFIRGTPVLIQIFLFYYGLPALGLQLDPLTAGICAIAFNSTIFISEIMRGGLADMDPGPVEAAIALGLKARAIWGKVVIPQLLLRILPPLVNEATIILKGTALLSVITVVELFRAAQQISATTFRPFETMLAAAAIILVLNVLVSQFGGMLERRLAVRRG